jgi:DNA-binding NarL/FixJ family response regulator
VSAGEPIRVLLADDQRLFVESLKYVLEGSDRGIEIVGIASDGEEAVRLAEGLSPDVILMDVRMPGMDGVDAARLIVSRMPGAKVIILSTFPDEQYLKSAVRNGARGYLLKNMRPDELVAAIRAVHRGATLFSDGLAERLAEREDEEPAGLLESLSPRESDVASLALRSFSNRQIAQRLRLSEQTVRNYVSSIYFKLGVKDRFEFMRLASGMPGLLGPRTRD